MGLLAEQFAMGMFHGALSRGRAPHRADAAMGHRARRAAV